MMDGWTRRSYCMSERTMFHTLYWNRIFKKEYIYVHTYIYNRVTLLHSRNWHCKSTICQLKLLKEKKSKKKDGDVWSLLTDVLGRENSKPWWQITTLWGRKCSRILFYRCLVLFKRNFKVRVFLWQLLLLFSWSRMSDSLWPQAHQASLSFTNLLELAQTHVHQVSDSIQPSHPLLLPSVIPSIRIFSNESALGSRWPEFRSFSFSISP